MDREAEILQQRVEVVALQRRGRDAGERVHEGSMLLWVLILALFGAWVATAKTSVPPVLRTNTFWTEKSDVTCA
jgi:hypothetical protein